ncbi:Protein of unknown function [Pyronema omphalodes CBS 100304]|uniref:Uncharacterized protein n=1 Tax=Pyronema omphalodes (strain CBS 100304) TaxID=1076935 RepID=U4LW54_PYROM|nr:Protein of unknown function [Pyronema omphalodes CBS 100304]
MESFLYATKYIARLYVESISHLYSVTADYVSPASEAATHYHPELEAPSSWELYLSNTKAPRIPEHKLHEDTLKTFDIHLGPDPIVRAQPCLNAEDKTTHYHHNLNEFPPAGEKYRLLGGEYGYSLTSFEQIRSRYCHHKYGRIPPMAPRIVKTLAEDVERKISLEAFPEDASYLSRFWAPRIYEASWQWTIWFGLNPRHVHRDWEQDGEGNWSRAYNMLVQQDSGYNSGAECLEEQEGKEAREIREMVEREKEAQKIERARIPMTEPKQDGPKISFLTEKKAEEAEEEKEERRRIQAEKDAAAKKAIDDAFNSVVWDDDDE